MRRTSLFCMPTLLLAFVIQMLGSLFLCLPYLSIESEARAAVTTAISPTDGTGSPGSIGTIITSGASHSPTNLCTANCVITGGTIAGNNLFHSFGDFSIGALDSARFQTGGMSPLPDASISNILARITGGPSNLFGNLNSATYYPSANLFLINPAGFLFGPNATVNVGGMVAFTTADYLRLANDVLFNAVPNAAADALLSAAPVAAFGFLGSNPGPITVQGSQLSVPTGQGISLIGGNITIQNGTLENGTVQPARLSAPNGQINLETAKSPGEFLQDLTAAPNVDGASFRSFGSVHLASGSTVDVSQTGNGNVSIRGGQLVLEIQNVFLSTVDSATPAVVSQGQDTIVLAAGSSILSQTSSTDQGSDVQIVADHLQFSGTPFLPPETPPAPVNIMTETDGSGAAGNITLTANQNMDLGTVTIQSVSPVSTGDAGSINLTSTNGNISMTNGVFVTSQAIGTAGKAGIITVNAPHGDIVMQLALLLNEIGGISGSGGGGIQVTANNLTMGSFSAIQIDNFNLPVPGAITVNLSGNMSLSGQAQIQTVARGPALAAADLSITTHDMSISEAGSFLNTETQSSGPGGHLNIFANNIQLTNGGQILSGSNPNIETGILPSGVGGTINIQGLAGPAASVLIDGAGSGIFANAAGTGAAGNTNIAAQSVTIQDGGTISASSSGAVQNAGSGGNITIATGQSTILSSGASINASSTGPGNAGSIKINAGQQLDMRDSSIKTEAAHAIGGDIKIQAVERVRLVNSTISTSVLGDNGSGGNIFIDPNVVVLQNSQVIAQAVQGAGGNITITTPLFLADQTSLVNASSQFGLNGTVTIQNPTSNLSESLGPLPSSMLEQQALQAQRCAALYGGGSSSFVIAGRDTIPTEPGGWLASPLGLQSLGIGLLANTTIDKQPSTTLVMTQTSEPISLRRLTPIGFLTQRFAGNGSDGCRS